MNDRKIAFEIASKRWFTSGKVVQRRLSVTKGTSR
jgi:hypothetical protein